MADTQLKTKILLRNDTATAWSTANPVLLKGEIGIEIDTNKFKIGDGFKHWIELSYVGTQVEVAGEGEVITGASVSANGTLTLTRGKLYLDDVLLEAPLTYTAPIGVKTVPASGSGTIGSAGGTLLAALNEILATEKNPLVWAPTLNVSLSNAEAKEVGTKVTPSYTISFRDGYYEYGDNPTGISPTGDAHITSTGGGDTSSVLPEQPTPIKVKIKDTTNKVEKEFSATEFKTTGTFPEITVEENTNYKVSASVEYGGAADPKTNLGKPVETLRIPNGTKNGTSGAITGYRNSFWGSVNSKDGTPTRAIIRGLSGKKNGAISAGYTGDASEAVGAMRVIIAVPSPRTITSIKDVNGLNAEAFSAFTHITVNVEGANGYEAKTYNVYYKDNAAANDKANKWHFTVA